MLDIDAILRPWWDSIQTAHGPLELYDAHTHIGQNDPDGFRQTPEELVDVMTRADARAVTFPMHEPGGYREANDVAIAAAAASDRLEAFCRLDPRDHPAEEARRCLDAGAVGIKLHPRAEQFGMDEPGVREIIAIAHERKVPVLIHAGRGIPALGQTTVALSSEFPGARLILAHGAISDLAWLWHVLPEHPNVFIDTSWWNPADLIALFALVDPSHIVWASDSPYGLPVTAAFTHARCALQAGVSDEALRSIMGGQMARLVAGEDPAWVGSAPGAVEPALHPLLDRIATHLITAMGRAFGQTDPDESIALARLSCAVGEDAPHADVAGATLELLDLYREHLAPPPPGRPFPVGFRFLMAALTVARTPTVPLPDAFHVPPPTRDEAEA
ncbi:putative TIM-barrel fold metal-dependent hydrolase [Solirubrobacter pauli]|uniref:Putative TIM-barrel fold metal-dependent hydrolase n=1 Tax=Solirubrobacter pauli TaxID=166793 RepID=A0A660LD68_9ACTN|nr:amidohydrolase family protein [Solirubrobacter pauli]RKQ91813.1 putative TIM-barrel fold metal-dependent hydrolase [Solirubrobacter pauli]